jgi:hypothetical protein
MGNITTYYSRFFILENIIMKMLCTLTCKFSYYFKWITKFKFSALVSTIVNLSNPHKPKLHNVVEVRKFLTLESLWANWTWNLLLRLGSAVLGRSQLFFFFFFLAQWQKVPSSHRILCLFEAGEIDEDTGKFYYFNKHLKGQTLTLGQGSKGWRARAASPPPSPFNC